MFKIQNVIMDRRYEHLRRKAPKLQEEPTIAGIKLKLYKSITVEDEFVEKFKDFLRPLVESGAITVTSMDVPLDAPKAVVVDPVVIQVVDTVAISDGIIGYADPIPADLVKPAIEELKEDVIVEPEALDNKPKKGRPKNIKE